MTTPISVKITRLVSLGRSIKDEIEGIENDGEDKIICTLIITIIIVIQNFEIKFENDCPCNVHIDLEPTLLGVLAHK